MTNEQALASIQKIIIATQTFNAQVGSDPSMIVPRFISALRQPELAATFAEYEEARATYLNDDPIELASDVAALSAIMDDLND